MPMYAHDAAQAYASARIETDAMSASPHQLVAMLFDGARAALNKARWAIEQGNVEAKGQALTKAISIIESGLRGSLDLDQGGTIAVDLNALYDYMARTLLRANLNTNAALVDEVDGLLDTIGSAWKEIGPSAAASAAAALP